MGSMKDTLGDDLFSPTMSARRLPPKPKVVLDPSIPEDVAELFERFAFQIKNQGFDRYSADAILHRIRWHFHIERGDREFACNNNYTAHLARWLMAKYPDKMAGFFETRERRK